MNLNYVNIGQKMSLTRMKQREKALQYTLMPNENKKNYCKIMMNVLKFKKEPVTIDYLKALLMKYGGEHKTRTFKSGKTRPERSNIEEERARAIIKELQDQGYLKYVGTKKPDKENPNIPKEGIKYFQFDKFKIIECEQSRYYKQKEQKEIAKIGTPSKISNRRCKALNQIYAHYTDSPFNYAMVRQLPNFYKTLSENKKEIPDEKTRIYYKMAAQKLESRQPDFIDIWNSLIRNNYIVPLRYKAKDDTIKIQPGLYKVNMNFVKRCLSEIPM